MGCNCGSNSRNGSTKALFQVTDQSGSKHTYSTEVEAAAAAQRMGGTYRRIS